MPPFSRGNENTPPSDDALLVSEGAGACSLLGHALHSRFWQAIVDLHDALKPNDFRSDSLDNFLRPFCRVLTSSPRRDMMIREIGERSADALIKVLLSDSFASKRLKLQRHARFRTHAVPKKNASLGRARGTLPQARTRHPAPTGRLPPQVKR